MIKKTNTAVFTEQKWDKIIKNKKLPKFFKRLSGFKSEFEYNTVLVIKICLQFQSVNNKLCNTNS